MSININSVLNGFQKYENVSNKTNNNSSNYDENIFAQATALVKEYKEKQSSTSTSTTSTTSGILGLSASKIADMSTSEFLKYAYQNESSSGFKKDSTDSSGIKLPLIVSYKGRVVSTAGKNFMSVVAKLKSKFPAKSEEEIAAELISKYGGNQTTSTTSKTSTTGNSINISA